MSPPSLSAIATELRQRHLPHWPSRSRSSRASAALFPTFTSFVKVGSTGRGEAPARAGARSTGERWCVVVLARALPGARHTKTAAKGGTRQSCPPPPIPNLGRWDSRRAERGARAGPVRSVGGRGCGERRSPPFARDSSASKGSGTARLRRRRLRRWVRHTVRTAHPPAAARGDAPLARGRAGGGSVSGRRSARAAPRPLARARRSRKAAVDVATARSSAQPYPLPSRCPARQPQVTRFAAGTATINRER